jgi:PAS domain-containing protein
LTRQDVVFKGIMAGPSPEPADTHHSPLPASAVAALKRDEPIKVASTNNLLEPTPSQHIREERGGLKAAAEYSHGSPMLAPAVAALKRDERVKDPTKNIMMERTLSEHIREEREDLKEAAEYSQSVVVDLSLDGVIRFVSPSWTDVVGTHQDAVIGRPIADILLSENDIFEKATQAIRKDDSRSQNVRFSLPMGPLSALRRKHSRDSRQKDTDLPSPAHESKTPPDEVTINLEGQGIMVYDRSTGEESHVSFELVNTCKVLCN